MIAVCLPLFTLMFLMASYNAYAATAQEVFERVAPSVMVVIALDAKDRLVMQGSGVVTGKDEVTTNCHVAKAGERIQVRQATKAYDATLHYADSDRDLCQLNVKGLTVPPVPMSMANSLKVGQQVYAIGAPQGLELTLTQGLISSLRPYEGSQLIQTDAAVSPGSSGGGLFDADSRLIGITSFQFTKGQNLNFALPVDWVKEIPGRAKKAVKSHPLVFDPKGNSTTAPEQAKADGVGWIGDLEDEIGEGLEECRINLVKLGLLARKIQIPDKPQWGVDTVDRLDKTAGSREEL
jgi:S1-C subfamily serine protease